MGDGTPGSASTPHGNVIYAAADDQTAQSLALILQRAGAVRAMELDINYEWTSFNFYGAFGARDPAKLLPDMVRPATRYLITLTTGTSSPSTPVANRRAAACRAAVHPARGADRQTRRYGLRRGGRLTVSWAVRPWWQRRRCHRRDRALPGLRPIPAA